MIFLSCSQREGATSVFENTTEKRIKAMKMVYADEYVPNVPLLYQITIMFLYLYFV